MHKILGAALIFCACGGCGFCMAAGCRREGEQMRQLQSVLVWITSELEFRRTTLPILMRGAAERTRGTLQLFFEGAAEELDKQAFPDANGCLRSCLEQVGLPKKAGEVLTLLAQSLGELDLNGQLQMLQSARDLCQRLAEELEENRDSRIRIYRTMGLGAGAVLGILLL